MSEAKNVAIIIGQSFKHSGKSCCEEELLHSLGKNLGAIGRILMPEQLFGGTTHHTHLNTIGLQQGSRVDQSRDLRTTGHQHHLRICFRQDNVSTVGSPLIVGSGRKIFDILSAQDECCGRIYIFHRHAPTFSGGVHIGRTEHTYRVAPGVIFEFLHEANLGFLFHWLVGRTILTNTKSIVTPDELDRKFHQGCHTNSGLHIVGENEERAHSRPHPSVQSDAKTDASHGQFADAGLQETSRKVIARDDAGVLEEAIRFVGIAEVCRRDNHIFHLFGEHSQAGCRCVAGRAVGLLHNAVPRELRELLSKPIGLELSFCGMSRGPTFFFGTALSHDGFQFFATLGIKFGHFLTHHKRCIRVATKVHHGVAIGITTERSTMRATISLIAAAIGLPCSFAHHGMSDDEGWSGGFGICIAESFADLHRVVAINFNHVPIPSTILHSGVFGNNIGRHGRQLHIVGIEKHNQVVQSQVPGHTTGALTNFLLNAPIGNISINLFFLKSGIAGTRIKRFGSDSGSHSIGMPLSERATGVFNTACHIYFRVAGCGRLPLTKLLQFFEAEPTNQGQLGIKHRRHVAGVEEKAVATFPLRTLRIVGKELAIQNVDEIGASHSPSWVAGLGTFNHTDGQHTDVVGSESEKF